MTTRLLFSFLFSFSLWAAEEPREKLATVYVEPAKKIEIADSLVYPAQLESKINARVLSESDGIVHKVTVHIGERVKMGQTLFILRHTDPIYHYAAVRIGAPVDGSISSLDVTPGNLVNKGQSLASITDPTQLHLKAEVPASDLQKLQAGMKAEFTMAELPKTINVSIEGISPNVDPGTGTATSIFKIDSDLSSLAPGLVGRVEIKLNARKTFVVPESAIVYRDNQVVLRVVKDSKIQQIPVSLGDEHRGQYEILGSDLKEGMLVVQRSSRFVQQGEKVTIAKNSNASGVKVE